MPINRIKVEQLGNLGIVTIEPPLTGDQQVYLARVVDEGTDIPYDFNEIVTNNGEKRSFALIDGYSPQDILGKAQKLADILGRVGAQVTLDEDIKIWG